MNYRDEHENVPQVNLHILVFDYAELFNAKGIYDMAIHNAEESGGCGAQPT